MREEFKFLRLVPIFSELDGPDLEKITGLGTIKKFKKGNVIVQEQEAGASLFIIITGKVKVIRTDEDGREVILTILSVGEFFGEMSLLDGMDRSATVVAISKTELFVVHWKEFLDLLHEFPQIATSLLAELARRLRRADAQIKSLSLKDAAGRVANVLIMLADELGMFRKGQVEIDELPLQQDLANMAGTSRETVSRMLHQFIRDGQITLDGNKVIIHNYEAFRKEHS